MQTVELWPFSQGEIDPEPDGFIDAIFALGPNLRHESTVASGRLRGQNRTRPPTRGDDSRRPREEWKLGEVTLDIETWPGSSTYIEVEGPSEDVVPATAGAFGFDFTRASYGSVDEVYLAVLDRDIRDVS